MTIEADTTQPSGHPLLTRAEGDVATLLGNEAIVRGALEAGVAFASGYPGTPSSEITDGFAQLAEQAGITFEYSVNEKIAVEMAFGACLAGARSICAMKHLGLMYAGDPLGTMPYIGTVAGLVIVSAGDPSCRTSPNEQDQRYLAPMLRVPMLDPSTPQEAADLTRFAFDLSEASRLPVILRPTTRVCHTRGRVRFGPRREARVEGFRRDPARFNPTPVNARRMRVELKERVETARRMIAEAGLVRREGSGRSGILAIGAPAATCADILRERGLDDAVVLISTSVAYPLPEDRLVAAFEGLDRLLVLEELSPFLEDAVTALCGRRGITLEILGKRTGHAPEEFEYEPPVIRNALRAALGLGEPVATSAPAADVPPRPPILCPGCPHRSTLFAARAAFDEDQLYFNDIGCYTLGGAPPLRASDALLCMGAGFTLASAVARVTGEKTVGMVGDSTFFHSGMPALLNAIKEGVDMVAVVLDNEVTAMTGFQESPTVHVETGGVRRTTSIENVVRALGAPFVARVDPHDLPAAITAFRQAHEAEGVGVVIAERACPIFLQRATGDLAGAPVFEIDDARCRTCGKDCTGTRCSQEATEPFSRQMARSRSLEMVQEPNSCRRLPDVAPCASRCPLDLCVQGYAAHIATGHYAEALELILERLPLPESVCRVCDRPCEDVCVRRPIDGAVAINDLKRFVVDWAADRPEVSRKQRCEPPHGHRVAVVGAGPAGLSAAHDLAVRGYEVTLYDAREQPGGLLRYGIPRYRLPADALDRDVGRVLALGVRFEGRMRLGKDVRLAELIEDGFDAVYLAVGAGEPRRLDLPSEGDGAPQMMDALAYLAAVATCAEAPAARRVVVLGGGNAAIDAARTARRRGADSVVVVCVETLEEMPAIADEVAHARREGIDIRTRTSAAKLVSGGLECVRVELDGERFRLDGIRPTAGTEARLEADLVIVAIGQRPDRSFLTAGDPDLAWTESGDLVVDPDTLATSHPHVFAGGDLAAGAGSVTGSIAAGLRAAWGIDTALRGAESADRRAPPPHCASRDVLRADDSRAGVTRADREDRTDAPERALDACLDGFAEVAGTLSESQARAEAARCMICGQCGNCRACIDTFGCPAFVVRDGEIEIDPELCNGCGVCAELCPNEAIVPKPAAV